MSNFGALTDHFGLATASLVLVDSSKVAIEQTRSDAPDENDDVADSKYHGNSAGELFDVSATYALISGTLDLATIKLGETTAGTIRSQLECATKNSAWPRIKVDGRIGCETVNAPSGLANTYSLPSITVAGRKQAQHLSLFTVSAGRLTGCTVSAQIKIDQDEDGLGEPSAHGVSGGTGTVSAEFVRITDAPAWGSLNAALTQITPPSLEEGQASHHTAKASAGFTLTRDNA